MEHLLRRLARAAAAAASEPASSPDMQPLPTPSIQNLAAAAAGRPPAASPTDAAGASGGSNNNSGWDLPTLNSTLADNFTLFTEGSRDHLTTPRGHVTSDQAWPVSSFAVIKALVLVVILAILVVVSCKVTMQYVIKSSKREKR